MVGFFNAQAMLFLPDAVLVSETVEDGKVTVEWSYDAATEPCDHFQVIVYKMHKATTDENFVLAQSDFNNIESTGTMKKHEGRGAIWDFLPDNPGWWVKYPNYMQGAMGIDAFQYFPGSDNGDIFGGSYMLSPDYDLSRLTNKYIKVDAMLGNEAVSVTGGFALYAWNTNWFDPKNIDYKPVYNCDMHYDDLRNTSWTAKSETLALPNVADYTDPDYIEEIEGINSARTRVAFYGRGYSIYWIDSFKLSVDMVAGDMVDYGASIHEVTGNSFTIDTSADTPDDYTYAYEIRPVKLDYDDYRGITTIRFVNYAYSKPRHIIGKYSGIEDVVAPTDGVEIKVVDGKLVVNGAASVQVYTVAGQQVYNGASDAVSLQPGLYIVKAGSKTAKIIL